MKSPSHNYNKYFSQNTIWDTQEKDIYYIKKKNLILTILPSDIKYVLDVGCGNGSITKEILSDNRSVVGVDINDIPFKDVNFHAVKASATDLPFGDLSFDCCMSHELLEHLNKDEIKSAIAEMQRVSKKYLLVSVPHQENLLLFNTKCNKCNTVFNIWGHKVKFSEKRLLKMFGKFQLLGSYKFGEILPKYNEVLLKIKQVLGRSFFVPSPEEAILCPACGNNNFVKTYQHTFNKVVCRMCDFLNYKIIHGHKKKAPYWIMLLLERE